MNIQSYIASISRANVTVIELSNTTVIANTDSFIGAASLRVSDNATRLGLQRMSQYLLNDKGSFEQSKYGAYVFSGDWMAPQTADISSYTVVQNSTFAHATATFMNVSHAA
jgi:hypothetical protein